MLENIQLRKCVGPCYLSKELNEINFCPCNTNKNTGKIYYKKMCRDCERQKCKQYHHNNKEQILERKRQYYVDNREKERARGREYSHTERGRETGRERAKRRYHKKIHKDIVYTLKARVGSQICMSLKSKGMSKNKKSCWKYLPFTPQELQKHIEYYFSMAGNEWMGWYSWGKYDPKTWYNNDPSTWKWNLDHIIPHAKFKYDIMDCDEFRKCWDISNLRPYSAKQNIIDGDRR